MMISAPTSIELKLIDSFNVGGGLDYHTDYKLSVTKDGEMWNVYRRYSSFEGLHKMLIEALGEERILELGLVFPDKAFLGSSFGTFRSVVEERIKNLRIYLNSLMAISEIADNRILHIFLDCDNKGISGMQVELGASKILKESFVKTKIFQKFGFWCIRFVVLLRTGTLLVLNSMYDGLAKPLVRIELTNTRDVIVIPRAADNGISISSKSSGRRIMLSFSGAAEAAFWIRSISELSTTMDYVLPTEKQTKPRSFTSSQDRNSNNINSRHSSTSFSSVTGFRTAKAAEPSLVPAKQIRAAGTGNTEDELSTMFGI